MGYELGYKEEVGIQVYREFRYVERISGVERVVGRTHLGKLRKRWMNLGGSNKQYGGT